MFADGRTVPSGERVPTDVCVIGAGLAGLVLAQRLAGAHINVTLLERGSDMGTGALEDLGNSLSVGVPYPIDKGRGTGLGGALHKWHVMTPLGDGFGRLREFAPDDFLKRSWIPHSGWPFSKDELAPYYREARRWFDTPWPSLDPEPVWDAAFAASTICDSTHGPVRSEVFAFANPGAFAADARRRLDRSEQALVLTHSTAVALHTADGESVVDAVEVATEAGRFQIAPKLVVLAAGGIENARLLLASRDRCARGLGNENDQVGRYFMEHPRFTSGLVLPSAKLRRDDASWDIHMHDGIPVQRKFRFSPETSEREGLPNSVYFLRRGTWNREYRAARQSVRAYRAVSGAHALRASAVDRRLPARPLQQLMDVLSGPGAVVRSLRPQAEHRGNDERSAAHPEGQLLTIEVMAEQVPNPESRVTLHHERDRFGVPKAALNWQFSMIDIWGAVRGQELFADHLRRKELGTVRSLLRQGQLPDRLHSAKHQMGTTRMDADPRRGVVDTGCAVHGTPNLYAAGPSVFPTGGDANPTLTIVAMALRLSDRLIARAGTGRSVG
jgi:choline dehydrogenase-like flavoprotein